MKGRGKGMKIKGEYRDVLSRNGEVIADTCWKSNVIVADYGRFLAALMKKDFEQKVGIDYMAVGSGSGEDYAVFKNKVEEFFKLGSLNLPHKPKSYWVWAKEIKDSDIKYLDSDEEGKEVEVLDKRYLFSWNDVPEKDSEKRRLINFLVQNPQRRQKDADWIKNAEIEKTDENKTINVIDKENKENSIILKRNEEENKVTLQEIRGKKTYEFGFTLKGKEENDKLNIYDKRITNRLKIDVKFGNEEPSKEPLEFKEFALLGIDKNSDGTFDTEKMFFINYVDHGVITKDDSMVLTRTVKLTFPINKEGKEEVVS